MLDSVKLPYVLAGILCPPPVTAKATVDEAASVPKVGTVVLAMVRVAAAETSAVPVKTLVDGIVKLQAADPFPTIIFDPAPDTVHEPLIVAVALFRML